MASTVASKKQPKTLPAAALLSAPQDGIEIPHALISGLPAVGHENGSAGFTIEAPVHRGAEVPAQAVAEVPAQAVAEVPAQAAVEVPAQVSSEIAGEIPTPLAAAAVAADLAEVPVAAGAAAEQVGRHVATAANDFGSYGSGTLVALAESQAAMARGIVALTSEVTELARSGLAVASSTAGAIFGIQSWADLVEINNDFTRSSVDALIGGAGKLSEISVRLATESSRPILSHFGEAWKSRSIAV